MPASVAQLQMEELPTYQSSVNPDKNQTRWIWYPGDVIDPKRKRELPHMRYGGDEYDSPCLMRTKRFIPRLIITPVEMAPIWTPPEMIADGAETVAPPPIQTDGTFSEQAVMLLNMAKGRTPGVKFYPGDGLASIMSINNNDGRGRRGVVELTGLKGSNYEEMVWAEIQQQFFGGMPDLRTEKGRAPEGWPETLNGARALVEQARKISTEGLFIQTAEQMLAACDDFEVWGRATINDAVQLTKTPASGGFVHAIPPVIRSIAAQLEITLEEDETRLVANALAGFSRQQVPTNDNTADLLKIVLENQRTINDLQARLTAIPTAVTETPKTAKKVNANA